MYDIICIDEYGNGVTHLTQWDKNQTLYINNWNYNVAPIFHFCNKQSKESLPVSSAISDGKLVVKIPNILLQTPLTILAYLYLYGENGSAKTVATISIPVRPKQKPKDYIYIDNAEILTTEALVGNIQNLENRVSTVYENIDNLDNKIDSFIQSLFNRDDALTNPEISVLIRDLGDKVQENYGYWKLYEVGLDGAIKSIDSLKNEISSTKDLVRNDLNNTNDLLSKYGLLNPVEVTSLSDSKGTYRVIYSSTTGELIIDDNSSEYTSYKFDPNKVLLKKVKAWSRGLTHVVVSFYSSDTPSLESYIAIEKEYKDYVHTKEHEIDILDIPEGTKSVLVSCYTGGNKEHHIYGFVQVDIPGNLDKYGLTKPIEITNNAKSVGNYRVIYNSNGELIIAEASTYTSYIFDPKKVDLKTVVSRANGESHVIVSFFSSDTPSVETYVKGANDFEYKGYSSGKLHNIDITDIPENAKIVLVSCFVKNNTEHYVYGIPIINLPDNILKQSQKLRIEAYEDIDRVYHIGDSDYYELKTIDAAFGKWKEEERPNAIIKVDNEPPIPPVPLSLTDEQTESIDPTMIYVYRVGANREFKSVIDAVEQWNADENPIATILVDSGVYITASNVNDGENPLKIENTKNNNRLTIIGETKETTIIRSTTGLYIHPPIDIKGGNVTIKNITFLADHSSNRDFNYAERWETESYNSAYGMHIDSSEGEGVIIVENCNCISHQSQAVGCGTAPNGHIIFKNCDLRTYAETGEFNSDDYLAYKQEGTELNTLYLPSISTLELKETNPEAFNARVNYAKYVANVRGSIIYHGSKSEDETYESFSMINCTVYAKNITVPARISRGGETSGKGIRAIYFKDTLFNVAPKDESGTYEPLIINGLDVCKYSSGNNISELNNNGDGISIKIEI